MFGLESLSNVPEGQAYRVALSRHQWRRMLVPVPVGEIEQSKRDPRCLSIGGDGIEPRRKDRHGLVTFNLDFKDSFPEKFESLGKGICLKQERAAVVAPLVRRLVPR
jgi:hypothetical protein